MKEHHDLALLRHWNWSHGQGSTWQTYCKRQFAFLALWMKKDYLQQIVSLPEGASWTEIPDAVLSCRNSCKTGEVIFDFCSNEVQFGLYSKRVDELVQNFAASGFRNYDAFEAPLSFTQTP